MFSEHIKEMNLRPGSTWERQIGKYVMKFNGRYLYCSCPSWKFQRLPPEQRVCKHIDVMFPQYEPQGAPEKRKVPRWPLLTEVRNLEDVENIDEFLWSEKYDGVRVHWDGNTLATRSGTIIDAPPEFTDDLPAMELDGELWAGRGTFEKVLSAIQVGRTSSTWSDMVLMVFDTPLPRTKFSDRVKLLRERLRCQSSCKLVQQYPVPSLKALQTKVNKLLKSGAEGIVLKHPSAPYRGGRDKKRALKYKQVQTGTAEVVEFSKGSYKVVVMDPKKSAGKTLKLYLSPHEHTNVGQTIEFEYRGFTGTGKPRHARFKG